MWRSDGGWLLSLSSATLHDGGAVEAILGLGWQRQLDARWQFQAGVARYLYKDAPDGLYPYTEACLSGGRLGWAARSAGGDLARHALHAPRRQRARRLHRVQRNFTHRDA
ncbi:hypothetical protein [Methyloversatilis thermotolerans]|uniref:hypothetical protein n=1 Tax=Methyloversatilis thermotolerans TaxID=1346290 RepID=UPI0003634E65|nr:hypothetical protein [Methyloversatilis thermotolerans]